MTIQALSAVHNDHSTLGSSSYLLQEFFSWIRTIPSAISFKYYSLYRGLQESMHLIGRGGQGENYVLCSDRFSNATSKGNRSQVEILVSPVGLFKWKTLNWEIRLMNVYTGLHTMSFDTPYCPLNYQTNWKNNSMSDELEATHFTEKQWAAKGKKWNFAVSGKNKV